MTTRELIINKLREANEKHLLISGNTVTCVIGILTETFGSTYQKELWKNSDISHYITLLGLNKEELLVIEDLFEENTKYKYFDILQFGPLSDYYDEIQKENNKAIDIIDKYLKELEHVNTDIDCFA